MQSQTTQGSDDAQMAVRHPEVNALRALTRDALAQVRSTDTPVAQSDGDDVQTLLGMYDEMADLLEASPEDCEALAYGLSSIIDAGAPRVHRLVGPESQQGQATLDPAQRAAATVAVERLGKAMGAVLPRCGRQLLPELHHMNELALSFAR